MRLIRKGAYRFQVPIYLNTHLTFCLGMSLKETRAELVGHLDEAELRLWEEADNDPDVGGRCVQLPDGTTIVRTCIPPNCPKGWAYLNHEIFHAADLMLRNLGFQLSNDSCEAWAYLIGWMTKELLEKAGQRAAQRGGRHGKEASDEALQEVREGTLQV